MQRAVGDALDAIADAFALDPTTTASSVTQAARGGQEHPRRAALPVVPAVFVGRTMHGRFGLAAAFTAGSENAARLRQRRRYKTGYLLLNLAAIVAGVVVGTIAFRSIAG